MVVKTGLGFVLTVINDPSTEDQDVFGSTKIEKNKNITETQNAVEASIKIEKSGNDRCAEGKETEVFSDSAMPPKKEEEKSQEVKTEDQLITYDYKELIIPLSEDISKLHIKNEPLKTNGTPSESYTIDGKKFRRQDVSGDELRCFFNAAGLKAEEEIKKLRKNANDPIVRYMIANEIVSAAANPEQIPESVKEQIQYTLYEIQSNSLNALEIERSNKLSQQSLDVNLQDPKNLPEELQEIEPQHKANLENLRLNALSLNAFGAFIVDHIGKKMMVAHYDVKIEVGDNPYANYTSIDAIAYLNKLGIRIYQEDNSEQKLKLAHSYIPKDAEFVVYLFHKGIHFQALVPEEPDAAP
jgi:hypothetical protein